MSLVETARKEVENLREMGTVYVGRCPFHKEETGSFIIEVERVDGAEVEVFHCFGCGRSGGLEDFIEYLEERE